MRPKIVISFKKGVSLRKIFQDQAILEVPWGRAAIKELSGGLFAALRLLSTGGASEDELVAICNETGGAVAAASMYYHLQRMSNLGLLCHTLVVRDGCAVATVRQMSGSFQFNPESVENHTRVRLSRFAYLRMDNDALVLESPLSQARTIIHSHLGVAVVADLTKPRSALELCARINNLDEDSARAILSLLVNVNLVSDAGENNAPIESKNLALAQWSFYDLLFHFRSRLGVHDYPTGGDFPFLDTIAPLPALKSGMGKTIIALHKPDILHLQQHDPQFAWVMDHRKSVRSYGDKPISAQQLGEFLYRVGRVRWIAGPCPAQSLHYQISSRPYPSGGASYDLELYPIVNTCAGISPGIYHYDPLNHQLCMLADRSPRMDALLNDAALCAGLLADPQILIVLASRFQRLSWKYSGIAYATTLKNVGVLYQTMYLVATAMGLAPCGLGAGNSALFAEAVGTDPFAESSVGEFVLGSAPEPSDCV